MTSTIIYGPQPRDFGRHRTARRLMTGVVATTVLAVGLTSHASGAATKKRTKASGNAATTTVRPTPTQAPLGAVTIAATSMIPSLDPLVVGIGGPAIDAMFETLVQLPNVGDVIPVLARSVTEAPDRLSWTINLRVGVLFHDGTVFDAEAVKFNLERARKARLFAARMQFIKTITVVDPLTVRLGLDRPYAALPFLLGTGAGAMLSPTAIKTKGEALGREPSDAGTGPYILKEFSPGERIVFVRNPNYWGDPKPRLDRITIRQIPDQNTQFEALRAGSVDVLSTLFPALVAQAKDLGFNTATPPTAGTAGALFNNARPPFDDARIRRAATLAIDWTVVKAVMDGGTGFDGIGYGLWPKNNPWYVRPETRIGFSQSEARNLVAAYVREKDRDPAFSLTINTSGANDFARILVKMWQDAGMDAKVQILPDSNSVIQAVSAGQYDSALWLFRLEKDPDPTAYDALFSGSGLNYAKYKSPEMDLALEQGRSGTGGLAARKEAYAKVQELFRRDAPFLIGPTGTTSYIFSKRLCGTDTDDDRLPVRTIGFVC